MASHGHTYRFEIRDKDRGRSDGAGIPADARALGLARVGHVRRARLYFVKGTMTPEELGLLGRFLFSDPVIELFSWRDLEDGREARADGGGKGPAFSVVEVAPRPGVTDPVAGEILRAASELGLECIEAAGTATRWELEGEGLDEKALDLLARKLLANPLVERWALGEIDPLFAESFAAAGSEPAEAGAGVELIPIGTMSDEELALVSRGRRAALDPAELGAIRAHFAGEGRAATDVEFEMIAQTWSEHCVHKTFKAVVEVEAPGNPDYPPEIDGILKTFIKGPSERIAAPWVLSAFVDNAGIIAFDEDHEVSFKVETHNHPSAVEPFGGANTGLGGVIRDIMGVSARPIAATDVLCFGPLDADPSTIPEGSLHPRLVAEGVVAGIADYGNKMGIPTVNGGLCHDPGYLANPLVYCGCVGLAPRGLHRREAKRGDRVVVLGGRTGRDGIRGATFSSMAMDAGTGEVAGASVQIGDPIAEKKALDVLLEARDRGLYDAVTDCGAGGLSSAVGEMASALGAEVDLSRLGTKYPGLAPWELWLSEAQERMVLAVPPGKMSQLVALCETYNSEYWDIGSFSGGGRIKVRHGGRVVLDLPTRFLEEGLPRKRLRAAPPAVGARRNAAGPARNAAEASARVPPPGERLLALLARPGTASKEDIVRRYDHEVQGGTLTRPYAGARGDAPQDAAVIKPQGTKGFRALAISNGFKPGYGRHDSYRAAISAHDEALRNLVAVGADPSRVAVLDNFCMGSPERPEVMWDLIEAARACRDAVLEHGTPFISGKDSFYNEYAGADGKRHAIPPSLLISAVGIVPDLRHTTTSDLKVAGAALYLVGDFRPRFGGSSHAELWPSPPGADSEVPGRPEDAPATYRALHVAICAGYATSLHDLSEGGLGVALAEMCAGGRLGAELTLDLLGAELPGGAPESLLFGESNGCLLVETKTGSEASFEALLAGLPFRRVGSVSREGRLRVALAGAFPVDLDIEALALAMRGGNKGASL